MWKKDNYSHLMVLRYDTRNKPPKMLLGKLYVRKWRKKYIFSCYSILITIEVNNGKESDRMAKI